jgi:hypothetical protein
MVSAGELDSQSLRDLYVQFLPYDTNIEEVGSPSFFLSLEQSKKEGTLFAPNEINISSDIIEKMVATISGWISTQQIDAEEFFKTIEAKPLHVSSAHPLRNFS